MPISPNVTDLPPQKPAKHRKSNHASSPDLRTPRGTLARTDSQPNASGPGCGKQACQEPSSRAARMLSGEAAIRQGFEQCLHQRWGRALDLFEGVRLCCLEAGEEFYEQHSRTGEGSPKLGALTLLHARGCLVSSEIHGLLRAGHDTMLAGPSNGGLADPGSGAMVSLYQVTTALVVNGSTGKKEPLDLIKLKAIAVLLDQAERVFFEIHHELQAEEAAIQAPESR